MFLDCGGKRSATPLWKLCPQSKSGVAAALCHRNPKSSRRTMILRDCSTCFFPDFAGKKRFACGEQPEVFADVIFGA
jgi:hypothetical protein